MQQKEVLRELVNEVLLRRDRAIVGCAVEIFVSLGSILLYDLRRSIVIPVINTILTLLSCIGLRGALVLSLPSVKVHGIVTTGLLLAAVLNLFCEMLFTHAGLGSDTLPGWLVLVLMITPYSLNLFCSSLSLMLLTAMTELSEKEEQDCGLLSAEELEKQVVDMRGSDLCCVCMDKRKDAVFTPCGHRAVCVMCGEILRARARQCPVCRCHIADVVKIYDA